MTDNYNEEENNLSSNINESPEEDIEQHQVRRTGAGFSRHALHRYEQSEFVKTLALICIVFLVILYELPEKLYSIYSTFSIKANIETELYIKLFCT